MELMESKDKTIKLLEDKVRLLEERMDIMKDVMQHMEINYDD